MLRIAAVESVLRKLLASPSVSLSLHPLKGVYAGQVGLSSRRILLNPFNGCVTDTVVHELIHLHYNRRLAPWGELEEHIVEAIEDCVVRYINRSSKRRATWHRLIQQKIEV